MTKKKKETYNEKTIRELEEEVEELKKERRLKLKFIKNPFRRFTQDQGMTWG